ncbi:hypothetical protein E2C01_010002 [Portunus trituberculatus]|uniref:Uncharacterized protein n=1 Tax=Portunus trituberculatus TaxID=210409 RepID=A0A5B7D7A7_PORTR|nr:hypothetical protein [Portunus trituberculatus]
MYCNHSRIHFDSLTHPSQAPSLCPSPNLSFILPFSFTICSLLAFDFVEGRTEEEEEEEEEEEGKVIDTSDASSSVQRCYNWCSRLLGCIAC